MKMILDVIDGVPVLRLAGEVDMSNTPAVQRLIATEIGNKVVAMVLDLSGVTYLDSAGIHLLYQLESKLEVHQQHLIVVVPTGVGITRTLQAAGVIGSFVLVSSVEAALVLAPRLSEAVKPGRRAVG